MSRSLELLWLVTVVVVPLVAVSKGYLVSEVVSGEAALLKIATLRTLVGLMVILWAAEWSLRQGSPFGSLYNRRSLLLQPSRWLFGLALWLRNEPSRWLTVAVIFFCLTTLLSTALSASFNVSLWGAVPGQDGYSTYTLMAYLLLFGVIATHLKTRAQLGRLLGAGVLMGVLLSTYAIFQHYGHDLFRMMEPPGGTRVTSTAGNPIFAASVMLMTITTTMVVATATLRRPMGTARFWLGLALWVPVMTVQFLGIIFTLSRGPWVGTALALGLFLTLVGISMGWRTLLRAVAVLALTGALTAAVILTPPLFNRPATVAGGLAIAQGDDAAVAAQRFASISSEVGGGGLSGRIQTWEHSWRLARYHPWFEFDTLSLAWLRPVIGYGPDLYRFTYFLESVPRGSTLFVPEAHHAHSYYVHQAVEQGLLGLVSSLGIVMAAILVGSYLLVRHRQSYSGFHKLVLIGLVATIAGRSLEQAVGVARVSDLMIFWVLLAAFVALPVAARSPEVVKETAQPSRGSSHRGRSKRPGHNSSQLWGKRNESCLTAGVWMVVLASLAVGIGFLTWFKTIQYPLAAREVAKGKEFLRQGNFEAGLEAFDLAVQLAPDVPPYYDYRAAVYEDYAKHSNNSRVPREKECSLQHTTIGISYEECLLHKAYLSKLPAIEARPLYFRSYLSVGETALELASMNPGIYPPSEAVRRYQKVVQFVPHDWRYRNKLALAYIKTGQPQAALQPLQESLALTEGTVHSAYAMYLQGVAHINMGQYATGVEYVEDSLVLNGSGSWATEAHEALVLVYTELGNHDLAESHQSTAASLAATTSDTTSGTNSPS